MLSFYFNYFSKCLTTRSVEAGFKVFLFGLVLALLLLPLLLLLLFFLEGDSNYYYYLRASNSFLSILITLSWIYLSFLSWFTSRILTAVLYYPLVFPGFCSKVAISSSNSLTFFSKCLITRKSDASLLLLLCLLLLTASIRCWICSPAIWFSCSINNSSSFSARYCAASYCSNKTLSSSTFICFTSPSIC